MTRTLRASMLPFALLLGSVACQCGSKPSAEPAATTSSKPYVPQASCPIARPAVAATGEGIPEAEEGDDVEIALIASAFQRSFEEKKYDEALACAQETARLLPDDPIGHVQRAMAFDALGEFLLAHRAFERAIALDPFNPDALLPAASYLVQVADNDSLEIAVVYARRGREQEKTARLAAELAAVEAEALNGLGRCEEALQAAESALALDSELPRATIERGVALFELLRFDEADRALAEGRAREPESAKAFHYSGLIAERTGRVSEADRFFAEATRLDPKAYPPMLDVPPPAFQQMVDEEVQALSPEHRAALATTRFTWEELPALDDLQAGEPVLSPTIVGIFRPGEPNAILLYRRNLLRLVQTKEELRREVRDTILHEIGHLNGEDDDELRDRGL